MLSLIKNSLSMAIKPHTLENLLNKIDRTEKEYFDSNMIYVDSIITLKDLVSSQNHCYKLSIPGYTSTTSRSLSILSPLGSELIGRKVGDEIHIKENGKLYWFRIISVKNKRH
ncbi:GreA/GreB family elongation factor [Photobacterium leiognathi]|uniref:GreA/GreB family elongation factor n=1 Tax=Photobacterium leiognathi TaxID=553611 RepID=UPI00076AD140|nr:GreA/GreB family elongation factor [Photobacterium leiognathi]